MLPQTPTFLYAYKNEANSWSRLRQMSTVFFPFRDVAYLDIYSGKHFPKATLLFGPQWMYRATSPSSAQEEIDLGE